MKHDASYVYDRSTTLRGLVNLSDRQRIRAVMDGGAEGVQAVLNWGLDKQYKQADLGVDLPTANVMYSGMERLAQKVGRPPTLKTDMIPTADTATARERAEKRARIVTGWDDMARVELQYPQVGRWLPGYGFVLHVIRERDFGGVTYPVGELRDPYDVYPGQWGPDQQPTEVAIVRNVNRKTLLGSYPEFATSLNRAWSAREKKRDSFGNSSGIPSLGQESQWEGRGINTEEVIEYIDETGTYVYIPVISMIVGYIPNPLKSGPAFVLTKRFSFNKLNGQYEHTFGLMAMMAKLNLLGLIATEEAVFRETNIIGELIGTEYLKGRKAINMFEPGTRIEKPTGDQLQQTWQAINILERQFRVVAGYDVAQDGQSPNSFATGQGIRELGASANENVKEYQTAIKHGMEMVDMKRLEWEERMHPNQRKRVYWYEGGNQFEETYVASKDIQGDYRTKRIYGAMATFDENSKIVAGLQLVQARIMDRRTMQENLDGFDNVSLINERIDEDMAKEMLIQGLGQRFAANDPAAGLALTEIMTDPGEANTTLMKLFTPREPQMSPEEQAMAMGLGGPGGSGGPQGAEAGPPPAVQTILAQMESEGGGVQSVGQMG